MSDICVANSIPFHLMLAPFVFPIPGISSMGMPTRLVLLNFSIFCTAFTSKIGIANLADTISK